MDQWINESILLPANPVSIVPAHGRIITKLACMFSQRRLYSEVAAAHAVDEFPNASGHIIPDALPLHIIKFADMTGDVRAVGERRPVQPLVEARALAAQRVISAATQI